MQRTVDCKIIPDSYSWCNWLICPLKLEAHLVLSSGYSQEVAICVEPAACSNNVGKPLQLSIISRTPQGTETADCRKSFLIATVGVTGYTFFLGR